MHPTADTGSYRLARASAGQHIQIILITPATSDNIFTSFSFSRVNYYDSLVLARRSPWPVGRVRRYFGSRSYVLYFACGLFTGPANIC